MAKPFLVPTTALIAVFAAFTIIALAPDTRAQSRPLPAAADNSPKPGPVPRRDLSGTWTPADRPGGAIQAKGVQAMPNDGKPEHALPYTPYGLELYRSHKALEGIDEVLPAFGNDPRNQCEPLGFPRMNHYNVRMTQIFQNPYKSE